MTNEWKEFLAYIEKPVYVVKAKNDRTYMGRFTVDVLGENEGMGHILTVLARGFLFHDRDGELLEGSAYDRIEYARRALCAWCSVPATGKNEAVNFKHLSGEFPELVNAKGEGWLYRHVKNIGKFAKKNESLIGSRAKKSIDPMVRNFTSDWTRKVKQMLIPLFAINTKSSWGLFFDCILADALELGPLRKKAAVLPPELEEKLRQTDLNGVPYEVVYEVLNYCMANKLEGEEYVVFPVSTFDCYFGSTTFSKRQKKLLPRSLIETEVANGVCRARVSLS